MNTVRGYSRASQSEDPPHGSWLERHHEVTAFASEKARAFVLAPLSPAPPLLVEVLLQRNLEQAALALGRLEGISGLLPDKSLFLDSYVRKEALPSSLFEGTMSKFAGFSAVACSTSMPNSASAPRRSSSVVAKTLFAWLRASDALASATILDFKTGSLPDAEAERLKREQYQPQMDVHRDALGALTGLDRDAICPGLCFVDGASSAPPPLTAPR